MNSLLQNGLLGMGGLGGLAPQPQGLLGNYYDPKAARMATLKNMLVMGGLGLAGDGWQGAARGAGIAAMETPRQFRDMAMDAYQMDRQAKGDAREDEKWGMEKSRWDAVNSLVSGINDPLVKAFPEQYAEAQFQQKYGAPASPTDDMREYEYARSQGFDGSFQDFMIGMRRAAAPTTNIDMKGQTSYAQERGKGWASRANEIDLAEQSGVKAITAISAMEQQMADPNFYSGTGANAVLAAKRAIVSLGGDPNQVSSMEGFAAQAKQLALDSMGGSLGTGFSNADRDFVTGQVAGLENTPQGNAALLGISKKINERKIQIARMAREYEAQNGQLDAGFFQQLSMWSEQNPLFVPGASQAPAAQNSGNPARRRYNPNTGKLE